MNPLPSYPGSKAADGVFQRLISLMPPHRVYVEGCLGGGALMRHKRPAAVNIGLDLCPLVIKAWRPAASPGPVLPAAIAGPDEGGPPRFHFARRDVLRWLASSPAMLQDLRTLFYVDPPYLAEVRTRAFYACEMMDTKRHARLLDLIRSLPCMVMISHYPCPLYNRALASWRKISYQAMTRGGLREECCWCNFPEPQTFHDVRYLGDGFRERERIKRKSRRWQARFEGMTAEERQVVAAALAAVDRLSLETAMGSAIAANGDSRGYRHK